MFRCLDDLDFTEKELTGKLLLQSLESTRELKETFLLKTLEQRLIFENMVKEKTKQSKV